MKAVGSGASLHLWCVPRYAVVTPTQAQRVVHHTVRGTYGTPEAGMNVSANVRYSQAPRGSLYSCPARSGCGSAAAWVRQGCGTPWRCLSTRPPHAASSASRRQPAGCQYALTPSPDQWKTSGWYRYDGPYARAAAWPEAAWGTYKGARPKGASPETSLWSAS